MKSKILSNNNFTNKKEQDLKDKDIIITDEELSKYDDDELLIICTGSQGETNSALTKIANRDYGKIKVGENDLVIISASAIPGNEKAINSIINKVSAIVSSTIATDSIIMITG